MVTALRLVLAGDVYLPPQLLSGSDTIASPSETDNVNQHLNKHGLTKRQMEALQYLAEGLSNKEIALKMNLAEGTIKVHVAATFQVLQVSSRLDAVRKAQKLGIITLAREGSNGV
jgi:two-component system nitrate/nitrite response regulator NarL